MWREGAYRTYYYPHCSQNIAIARAAGSQSAPGKRTMDIADKTSQGFDYLTTPDSSRSVSFDDAAYWPFIDEDVNENAI
uniref:Uncharacterized protein n=1 Tax=Ditylenchus dipsaci TaxID=166011 RepID=A0A915EKD3_9BILA